MLDQYDLNDDMIHFCHDHGIDKHVFRDLLSDIGKYFLDEEVDSCSFDEMHVVHKTMSLYQVEHEDGIAQFWASVRLKENGRITFVAEMYNDYIEFDLAPREVKNLLLDQIYDDSEATTHAL